MNNNFVEKLHCRNKRQGRALSLDVAPALKTVPFKQI